MRIEATAAVEDPGPFTVHTDVFEGPLDLLLYLVKRDGIDLRNLEVAHIADAYLAYLDHMRALDLSLAADWLVMAATLVYLKSLELLPRPPALLEEEEIDPREKLRKQLEAYERVKAAALLLDEQDRLGREVIARRGQAAPPGPKPARSPIDAFGLLDLYFELLKRRDRPDPTVQLLHSGPDVGACCRRILDALGGRGRTTELTVLLSDLLDPAERVVTFVGALEMTRLGWLDVMQHEHLGPITVTQRMHLEDMDLELVIGDAPAPAPSSAEVSAKSAVQSIPVGTVHGR